MPNVQPILDAHCRLCQKLNQLKNNISNPTDAAGKYNEFYDFWETKAKCRKAIHMARFF
jgi:hypothetical protein